MKISNLTEKEIEEFAVKLGKKITSRKMMEAIKESDEAKEKGVKTWKLNV
ncbi:MAG: hypothetical protein Q8R00_02070 [Candidatus Nanoarchaeia archaeon]|nr:hypothetical protein [Candidatus Nanoarchaeia archaeon]